MSDGRPLALLALAGLAAAAWVRPTSTVGSGIQTGLPQPPQLPSYDLRAWRQPFPHQNRWDGSVLKQGRLVWPFSPYGTYTLASWSTNEEAEKPSEEDREVVRGFRVSFAPADGSTSKYLTYAGTMVKTVGGRKPPSYVAPRDAVHAAGMHAQKLLDPKSGEDEGSFIRTGLEKPGAVQGNLVVVELPPRSEPSAFDGRFVVFDRQQNEFFHSREGKNDWSLITWDTPEHAWRDARNPHPVIDGYAGVLLAGPAMLSVKARAQLALKKMGVIPRATPTKGSGIRTGLPAERYSVVQLDPSLELPPQTVLHSIGDRFVIWDRRYNGVVRSAAGHIPTWATRTRAEAWIATDRPTAMAQDLDILLHNGDAVEVPILENLAQQRARGTKGSGIKTGLPKKEEDAWEIFQLDQRLPSSWPDFQDLSVRYTVLHHGVPVQSARGVALWKQWVDAYAFLVNPPDDVEQTSGVEIFEGFALGAVYENVEQQREVRAKEKAAKGSGIKTGLVKASPLEPYVFVRLKIDYSRAWWAPGTSPPWWENRAVIYDRAFDDLVRHVEGGHASVATWDDDGTAFHWLESVKGRNAPRVVHGINDSMIGLKVASVVPTIEKILAIAREQLGLPKKGSSIRTGLPHERDRWPSWAVVYYDKHDKRHPYTVIDDRNDKRVEWTRAAVVDPQDPSRTVWRDYPSDNARTGIGTIVSHTSLDFALRILLMNTLRLEEPLKGSRIQTGLVVKPPKWRRPRRLDSYFVGPLYLLRHEEWTSQVPEGGRRPYGNGWYYAIVDVGRYHVGDVRVQVPTTHVLGSIVAYVEGGYEHVAQDLMRGGGLIFVKPMSVVGFPLQDSTLNWWAIRVNESSRMGASIVVAPDHDFLQRLIVGAPS